MYQYLFIYKTRIWIEQKKSGPGVAEPDKDGS
jgi:hypothetical protein